MKMQGISLLLTVILLPGCAADRALSAAKASSLEGARVSSAHASTWEQRFMACVRDYAGTRAATAQPASDIADAAIAGCQTPLAAYTGSHRNALSAYKGASASTPAALTRAWNAAEYEAQADAAALVERARQAAVQAVVDRRN